MCKCVCTSFKKLNINHFTADGYGETVLLTPSYLGSDGEVVKKKRFL